MKTFEYRGYNQGGKSRQGLIEALDAKDARERLAQLGILTEKVTQAGLSSTRKVFKIPARAMFYRELGSLLEAGLGMDQAFEVLVGTPELKEQIAVIAYIRDQVRDGQSLADACLLASPRVSGYEQSLIRVGEQTGNLARLLLRIADFLEEEETLHEKIITALFYPCLVLILGLVVSVVMLGFVLPRFEKLMSNISVELPLITRIFLGTGSFMSSYGLLLIVVPIITIPFVARFWRRRTDLHERCERCISQGPVIGETWKALMNLRFSRTLALLIEGDVPIPEGLALAGKATGSGWLHKETKGQSAEIQHGLSLADAVSRIPVLGETLPGWIRAGEAAGDLTHLLESASARFQRTWEKRIARLMALLEPFIIIAIGLFVLLVALAVLQPVLSLNKMLAQ